MKLKRIVSLLLMFTFILLLVTGIVLYIVPAGRIAYWADWKFIGLTKEQWGNIHVISGFLGLVAAFIHIIYNWSLILNYLKNRKKEIRVFNVNFNIALLITLAVLVGTYFHIPPLSWILEYSEEIKDAAAEKYGEPPYSHAELSTIKEFCQTMQIDPGKAMDNLKKENVRFTDEKDVLKDIAANNGMSPQELYLIMRAGEESKKMEIPQQPPMGTGKKTLKMISEQYQLDLQALRTYLTAHQIEAAPDMQLKEIAESEQIQMMELYNMIRTFAGETNSTGTEQVNP